MYFLASRLQWPRGLGDSFALQFTGEALQRRLLRGVLRVQRQQPRALGLPAPGLRLSPPLCECIHHSGGPPGSLHLCTQQVTTSFWAAVRPIKQDPVLQLQFHSSLSPCMTEGFLWGRITPSISKNFCYLVDFWLSFSSSPQSLLKFRSVLSCS